MAGGTFGLVTLTAMTTVMKNLLSMPGAYWLQPFWSALFRFSSSSLNLSMRTSWRVCPEQNWLISWLSKTHPTVFYWRSMSGRRIQYSSLWFSEPNPSLACSPPLSSQKSGSLHCWFRTASRRKYWDVGNFVSLDGDLHWGVGCDEGHQEM